MATFFLPPAPPLRPPQPDPTDLAGEDILFQDRLEVAAGDWRTVTGSAATDQSVRREASSNAGSLLRVPDWGMGITQTVFRGITRSASDALISRVRNRMRVNPRVAKFLGAEVFKLSAREGQAVAIRYQSVGSAAPSNPAVIKGGG